jgi:hypothetical protein
MRAGVLAAAVAGIGCASAPVMAQIKPPAEAAKVAAAQADVPVKVVVLFSSGVGYFEHFGNVKGDSSTELRFKTNQINDILKSLVLQDMDGGKVSSVVYPSQDPISKTLKSFQVDITGNPPFAELLNQLRGAKVKVTAGPETQAGTILGVEKKQKAVEKGQIDIWVLNLINGATIRAIPLDDVTKLELEDVQLQEELTKALAALAQSRDQEKKPVTIGFQGAGERRVRVGYVVETPIWKTSYRLLISNKADGKSSLQGWAIVENQTDNDWNNVSLSLVSGRPISFIQELYQPLYIPRPVVQPELYASLRPQTYEGGMELLERRELAEADKAGAAGGRGGGGGGAFGRSEQLAARRLAAPAAARGAVSISNLTEATKLMDAGSSIESVASAAKIGELFEYTVGNVSLPRQRSAMIPIITDPIEVEKLSIYNMNVLPKNPLNGARVKNTTQKHLLQGPITVIDAGTYAGDARIDNLPPGQERLLSYGVDLQMLVNATKNRQESAIQSGKVVKGVLNLKRKHVFTQYYTAENKDTEKEKTLVVEHPFRQGWKLTMPEKAMETTEALYRFKEKVPAGKSANLIVQEEIVQGEVIQILPMDYGTLDYYSKNGEISKDVREAMAKAGQFKQQMEETRRQVEQRKAEINQITQEQVRIRENMKAVQEKKGAYYTRLEQKLNDQESQIESTYKKMDEQQKLFEKQQKELEDYLNNLNVGA